MIKNKINGYIEDNNGSKYPTLIPFDENKGAIKNIAKYGIKLSTLLSQKIMTQSIMTINIRKSNLTLMII